MDPKKTYNSACELLKEGYENLSTVTPNQLAMANVYRDSALSFNRAISKIELLKKYAEKQAKKMNGNNSNMNGGKTRKRSKSN